MARTQKKSASAPTEQRTKILRVAGYLRVSTDEQARSGLGLAAQRAQIMAMATVKGWPEPVIYSDEGQSGTKDWRKRDHLRTLMEAAQAGEIDAVIVSATDRLARNTRITLDIVDTLRRAGVILVSCKESLDTTTSQGQFFLTIIAGWAQLERDQISERTIAALGQVKLRTGDTGGHLPYGYVRANGYIAAHIPHARIVQRIFTLRAEGVSLRAIAKTLNIRRYPSPQGGRWHHSSVQAVLANERYYRGAQIGASDRYWPIILKSASRVREAEMDDNRPYAERFAEAQTIDAYKIRGRDYPRIRYGDERDWTANPNGCHDCGAKPGQLHMPGCDVERCPRCGGQSISCDCDDLDDSQVRRRV